MFHRGKIRSIGFYNTQALKVRVWSVKKYTNPLTFSQILSVLDYPIWSYNEFLKGCYHYFPHSIEKKEIVCFGDFEASRIPLSCNVTMSIKKKTFENTFL